MTFNTIDEMREAADLLDRIAASLEKIDESGWDYNSLDDLEDQAKKTDLALEDIENSSWNNTDVLSDLEKAANATAKALRQIEELQSAPAASDA